MGRRESAQNHRSDLNNVWNMFFYIQSLFSFRLVINTFRLLRSELASPSDLRSPISDLPSPHYDLRRRQNKRIVARIRTAHLHWIAEKREIPIKRMCAREREREGAQAICGFLQIININIFALVFFM